MRQSPFAVDLEVPLQPVSLPEILAETHPFPEISSPTALALSGEYKQVTICGGLVAAASDLARHLGPEAMHQVMQMMFGVLQQVMEQYGGSLIEFSADGFLVLFGAPVAQEDHAPRAVLAALALHERLRESYADSGPLPGKTLTVGLGVHTGRVVVDRLGDDPQRLYTASGETTQVAIRLRQLAVPGTVLLSAATQHLVHEEMWSEPAGEIMLDGNQTPIPVYRVRGVAQRRSGVIGHGVRMRSSFVGREQELTLLQERLDAVVAGEGQVVELVGEPGMGKSRLLAEFRRRLAESPVVYWEGHCLSYGSATPYLPVADIIRQLCGSTAGEPRDAITANVYRRLQEADVVAEEGAPLVLQLLDVPVATDRLAKLSPQARKARAFALLRQLILHEAQRQPCIMAVENLHWIDATSEEWLVSLIERLMGTAILLLVTYRPGYQPPWLTQSYTTQITLPRLRSDDSRTVVQAVLRTTSPPDALLQEILLKAAGNPFFLEELAWNVVEHGAPHLPLEVPETIEAVLAARLDRLPPRVKQVLQTAAVIGMQMTLPLLQAVADLSEDELHLHLGHLQRSEFLYEAGGFPALTYTFKHALTREVAYQSLLRRTRQQVHKRIAQVLAAQFPGLVERQPELLAHHCTEAGLAEEAVGYWQRAGQHASDRSAHLEAISHLTTGIELLKSLPETPEHTQQALTLYTALGTALVIAKGQGAHEVEHAYIQAHALCQQVGETPELFPVLYGLYRFYLGRLQLHTAREIGETLLRLAQRADDPALAVLAHYALGLTWLCFGALPAARLHLEEAIARYTPDQHRALVSRIGLDPGITCRTHAAVLLWLLGYPEQALARLHEALALAHEQPHPHSLAGARCWAAYVYQFRWDVPAVYEQAEAAVALSIEQGFPFWAAAGTILRGWALAMQGQGEEGLSQVCQGIAAYRATEAPLLLAYYCTLRAEVSAHLGHPEDGLQALVEAHTLMEQQEERYWEAEVCRLRGVLLLRQPGASQAEAEAWVQRALDVARRQEAKSLELRAAMSLARLWQQQGKHQEARELLAPIYGWFTEGFDTADLQEAKALLGV